MSDSYVRPDGRGTKQLRDLKVEVGILDRAEGSARVDLGNNIAVASVYGPREMHPKHAARSDRAVMRVNYRMATFSVDGYKRSYPSRREKEISKVLSEAYESVVLTKNWPRSVIDVHIEIFQSDGGTRTAASIAITAALADAGIPMRDLTGGIASGLYEDHVVLDLNGQEDMKGTGDMPILYSPSVDEISLFQLDGQFTFEQFKEAFNTSKTGIRDVVEVIQNALKEKYLLIREQYGVDDEDDEDQDYDDEDDYDEDEEDEEEEEEEDEEEEELTPVPSEPIGEAHSTTVATDEEEEEVTPVTSSNFVVKQTPTTDSGLDETPAEEKPSEETEDESKEIKNTWFNKPGAELRPMKSNSTSEEDDDDSENVMRDIEYSQEE